MDFWKCLMQRVHNVPVLNSADHKNRNDISIRPFIQARNLKEPRLNVSQQKVLNTQFRLVREDTAGRWEQFNNEKHRNW
jgi:hypothetical protein